MVRVQARPPSKERLCNEVVMKVKGPGAGVRRYQRLSLPAGQGDAKEGREGAVCSMYAGIDVVGGHMYASNKQAVNP